MSAKQMEYFYHSCMTGKAADINYQALAYALCNADEVGQKEINRHLRSMDGSLSKYLIKE